MNELDALKCVRVALTQHIDLVTDDVKEGNYWAGDGNRQQAKKAIQNFEQGLEYINKLIKEKE